VWLVTKLSIYELLYEHLRLLTWDDSSPLTWVIGIVAYDLLFYAWHRTSHRVNVLWAAHAVHHQSEDFNLAVALRQGWFEEFTSLMFQLWLAFLGISPLVYAGVRGISLFYQFVLHTQLVESVPCIEGLLNTPSAHRVHHGINPQYIDKNYGGIFMIWDRVFGTFQKEHEKVHYGVTDQLRSFSPVWANFAEWVRIKNALVGACNIVDVKRVLLGPPEFLAKGSTRASTGADRARYTPILPASGFAYVTIQLLIVSAATVSLMLWWEEVSIGVAFIIGVWILVATLVWSGLSEGKAWARWIENGRLATTCGLLAVSLTPVLGLSMAVLLAAILTLPFLFWLDRLAIGPNTAHDRHSVEAA